MTARASRDRLPRRIVVTVELELEGDIGGAQTVVESVLDTGVLQDAVNSHSCEGVGALRVESALIRLGWAKPQ